MKYGFRYFPAILIFVALIVTSGCDSGGEVVDEVTGNRAVKQYHESEKKIEAIVVRQAERFKDIEDSEDKEQ